MTTPNPWEYSQYEERASGSTSGPRPGSVVAHRHQPPWEPAPRVRHGVVVALDDPAIVGTNDDGTDATRAHAHVAWFGTDGVTSVPVDELEPIG